MKALLQRVSEAGVSLDGEVLSAIGPGLVVLVCTDKEDTEADADFFARKIANMRLFADSDGKSNLSVLDVGGEALVISQFTLHASTKKGNRPSFTRAAKPEVAIPLYEQFIATLESELGQAVQVGEFGADMKVALINDGPVTLTIDTKNRE